MTTKQKKRMAILQQKKTIAEIERIPNIDIDNSEIYAALYGGACWRVRVDGIKTFNKLVDRLRSGCKKIKFFSCDAYDTDVLTQYKIDKVILSIWIITKDAKTVRKQIINTESFNKSVKK